MPEVASACFGSAVSANQLLELGRDSISEDLREAGERPELRHAAQALDKVTRDLRLAMGTELRRGPWSAVSGNPDMVRALDSLVDALHALHECLEPLAPRGKGLESCLRRCADLSERVEMLGGSTPDGFIHWFETHPRSFSIHLTPMDVAAPFRRQMENSPCAWVFTSATLTVEASFSHFAARLGVEEADTGRWESPFDFRHQALLYVPPDLPEPASPYYTEAVVEAAVPVLAASAGRAFMLFTSHRALREAAELLQDRLPYPLLVQGESPRARLLARFRELGNAVLLGTGSFWEGVDVRGGALSCVIIDKLPFASPGDPILRARIDALREQGGNPFLAYQLPQAVITLKQGGGGLIRDMNDRGLLMICDPRLRTKSYGRIFLDSLPPMPRTTQLEVVERFFALEEKSGEILDGEMG